MKITSSIFYVICSILLNKYSEMIVTNVSCLVTTLGITPIELPVNSH